jgi:hypothetical protein
MMVHACNPSTWETKTEDSEFEAAWLHSQSLSQKQNQNKTKWSILFSKFQVHDTVLLTLVTMQCIGSPRHTIYNGTPRGLLSL